MTVPFNKTPLDYQQQLQLLESRGLIVADRAFALHCLQHINYYRLSAYRFPLTVAGNPDQFLPGVTFADLWTLYDFDQTLRRLLLDAAKRVEVSIRSHWAYVLGHKYGPFCYDNSTIFANVAEHQKGIVQLHDDLAKSKEDFVKHFKVKYGTTHPPIWAVCEVMSLGQISRFYQNIKEPADRKAIADPFGLDETVLTSYLNHLTVARNTAAHHARLWNRRLSVKFKLPHKPTALKHNFNSDPASEQKIYNTFTMLLHLLGIIDPKCPLCSFLYRTIDALDAKYHPHMGFPTDWKQRSLWQTLAPASEARPIVLSPPSHHPPAPPSPGHTSSGGPRE